jgi:hypothetical protein
MPLIDATIPYIDTVNSTPSPKNLPDLWVTLEFNVPSEERLSIGPNALFREFGVVNVVVLGLSGRGDDAVVQAAEVFKAGFQFRNATLSVGAESGVLRIDTVDPPSTELSESGNWFLCSVTCAYTLDVVHSG